MVTLDQQQACAVFMAPVGTGRGSADVKSLQVTPCMQRSLGYSLVAAMRLATLSCTVLMTPGRGAAAKSVTSSNAVRACTGPIPVGHQLAAAMRSSMATLSCAVLVATVGEGRG